MRNQEGLRKPGFPYEIDWCILSLNPNAIQLLEQNPEKIDWKLIWMNPSIFGYDYKEIRKWGYDTGIFEEMMAKIFHPKNIHKFADYKLGMGYDEEIDYYTE